MSPKQFFPWASSNMPDHACMHICTNRYYDYRCNMKPPVWLLYKIFSSLFLHVFNSVLSLIMKVFLCIISLFFLGAIHPCPARRGPSPSSGVGSLHMRYGRMPLIFFSGCPGFCRFFALVGLTCMTLSHTPQWSWVGAMQLSPWGSPSCILPLFSPFKIPGCKHILSPFFI